MPPSRTCRSIFFQDLAVKLSEVLVGVSVIAAVEGPASLAELASASMVGLVTGASGHAEAIHGVVLQALMPVILMATGKPDVPPRYVSYEQQLCLV